jgi:hypothetical protein
MQETIRKEQALHKLMSKVPNEATRSGTERCAAIASILKVPAWSVGFYLNKLHGYLLSMDSSRLSLTAQITRLIRQVCIIYRVILTNNSNSKSTNFWGMHKVMPIHGSLDMGYAVHECC